MRETPANEVMMHRTRNRCKKDRKKEYGSDLLL